MYEPSLPIVSIGAIYYYIVQSAGNGSTQKPPIIDLTYITQQLPSLYFLLLATAVYFSICVILVVVDGFCIRPLLSDAPILTGGERARVFGRGAGATEPPKGEADNASFSSKIANFRTFAGISSTSGINSSASKGHRDDTAGASPRMTIKLGVAYRSGEVGDALLALSSSESLDRQQALTPQPQPPKTIIDLRAKSEAAAAPTCLSPSSACRIVPVPITPLPQSLLDQMKISSVKSVKNLMIFHPASLFAPAKPAIPLHEVYTLIVERIILEPCFADSAVSKLIKLAGEPQNHPILWHCSEGKDRTGAVSALFLLALGVPRGVVVDDFLLSNKLLYKRASMRYLCVRLVWLLIGNWVDFVLYGNFLGDLMLVQEETLERCFAQVDAVYGGFNGRYWEEQGVTEDDLKRLREAVLR